MRERVSEGGVEEGGSEDRHIEQIKPPPISASSFLHYLSSAQDSPSSSVGLTVEASTPHPVPV